MLLLHFNDGYTSQGLFTLHLRTVREKFNDCQMFTGFLGNMMLALRGALDVAVDMHS